MDYTSWLNLCLPVIMGWLYRLDKRISRIETTLSILSGLKLENDDPGCPKKELNVRGTIQDILRREK